MIAGFIGLLIANAAVVLGARALLEKCRTGNGSLDLLLFLLLRLLLISGAVLALGLVGNLSLLVLTSIALVGLAVCFPLLLRGSLGRPALPRLFPWFWVLLAAIGARLLLQAWFFAPYLEDVLGYHLPKVAEWVQAGGLKTELGMHTHATFPAGFELVEVWWVIFLHHDVLIEMAGLEFLLLGAAAVQALGSRIGMSNPYSAAAGLAYAVVPGLHAQATSCMNDGAVAALVLCTTVLIMARAPLPWVLISVGMGIGIKPTYLYASPGLLLLEWMLRRELRTESVTRFVAVGAAAALVIGLYWPLRNLVRFGNPIHPVGLGGLVDAHGGRWIQFGPDPFALLSNLGSLLGRRIWDITGPSGGSLREGAGWGALAVLLGIPCLLILLRRDQPLRRLSLAFTVSLITLLALVLHDPWSLRFVLFFPALLILAAFRLAERHRSVRALAGISLAVQLALTTFPAELPTAAIRDMVRQPWRERSASFLYDVECPVDRVGYLAANRGPAYLFYGPDLSRRVVYLRPQSAADLKETLGRERLRLVYAHPGRADQEAILAEAERRGFLRPLRDRFYRVP